jgi:flavin reductase (DIM6/NTAB) family NADH-FMN oxidoreductase RutF
MKKTDGASAIDPLDLRRAFGRFGTGVTVITTQSKDGQRVGITANSFNTVSLEPPIVLWSLASASPNLEAFQHAGYFIVNVLTLDQLEISKRFSKHASDKFTGIEFTPGINGIAALSGCAATIECSVVSTQAVGDHVLFLGKVERYAHMHADPLLFYNGKYIKGMDISP